MLVDAGDYPTVCLSDLTKPVNDPASTLVVNVHDADRRADLIRTGFGDAIGHCGLGELEARAIRLGEWVPRYRRHDRLELDIVARDAFVGERPLGLHPREFGLLWRLMATPDRVVGKQQLLREVWRLRHVPETNSLAVHACRLRKKLADMDFPDRIVTEGDGYWFRAQGDRISALPLRAGADSLDAHLRLTDDPLLYETVGA